MTVTKYQKSLPITPREIQVMTSGNATGSTGAFNLGAAYSKFGIQGRTNASEATVTLQGSISGGSSDWVTLVTWQSSAGNVVEFTTLPMPVTRIRASLSLLSTTDNNVHAWVSASY